MVFRAESGRRQFLAETSACALAFRTSAQATAGKYDGKLGFSFDDSPPKDYTKTFPVHQDEGVPTCRMRGGYGLNHDQFLDTCGINRAYFREGEMAERQLALFLDGAVAQGALWLLGGHNAYDSLTAPLRMANGRNRGRGLYAWRRLRPERRSGTTPVGPGRTTDEVGTCWNPIHYHKYVIEDIRA